MLRFSLFLFISLFPLVSLAVPATEELSAFRSDFSNLKIADSDVIATGKWEELAGKLGSFIEKSNDNELKPQAMSLVGNLYEYIYEKKQFQSSLYRALWYYKKITTDYPKHSLADDALFSSAMIHKNYLGDKETAESNFTILIREYPESSFVDLARGQLGEMRPEGQKDEAIIVKSQKKDFSKFVVVLDPGHGGDEEGALGVNGLKEKDLVLEIAKRLKAFLTDRLGAEVILTRERDVHVAFPERTKIANDANADVFISIHANASEAKNASGIETYYLDNTNDKSSLKLAERENRLSSEKKELGDLEFILSDLIQSAKIEPSKKLSNLLQESLMSTLSFSYDGVRDLGVRKAPFYVLVGAHMPCSLVEVSFIDHPVEGARLAEPVYQELIAEGLFVGIKRYLSSYK